MFKERKINFLNRFIIENICDNMDNDDDTIRDLSRCKLLIWKFILLTIYGGKIVGGHTIKKIEIEIKIYFSLNNP